MDIPNNWQIQRLILGSEARKWEGAQAQWAVEEGGHPVGITHPQLLRTVLGVSNIREQVGNEHYAVNASKVWIKLAAEEWGV